MSDLDHLLSAEEIAKLRVCLVLMSGVVFFDEDDFPPTSSEIL